MRIEIIAIGDELLDGRTRDLNVHYLGGRLRAHGAILDRVTFVDDTLSRLPQVFREAAARADLVVTSGGLGPTLDDMTREAIAEAAGVALELRDEIVERIRARFQMLGMDMADNNRRQAMMPQGCTVYPSTVGTADAFETVIDGTPFLSLPGVPFEFRHFVEERLVPRFADLQPRPYYSVHAFGRGESDLARSIEGLDLDPGIKITWSAKFPIITIEFSVDPGHEALLEAGVARIEDELAPWLFHADNRSASRPVADELVSRGWTLATAESCTGGLIASHLTDLPGASAWFNRGYVTYSNDAKMTDLGVRASTLETHGAVSVETAREMAIGARRIAEANVAVSVTGIAGPSGGSEEKPVGTVMLACATATHTVVLEAFAPRGGRHAFKALVSELALVLVLRVLEGRHDALDALKVVRAVHVFEEP